MEGSRDSYYARSSLEPLEHVMVGFPSESNESVTAVGVALVLLKYKLV